MSDLKLAIASDHAGWEAKEVLSRYLKGKGYEVKDFGTNSPESVDYPDYAHVLARAIENNEYDYGIALCASGNGISMTLNKHQKIRAALCWNVEIAEFARRHNNANICALPGRFIPADEAIKIVDKFINTGFDGGRHERRVNKIPIN